MIREEDLLDAIAECQGQRNPNASTCIKLASFYTILDHLTEKTPEVPERPAYSFAAAPGYESDTEFGQRIRGMDVNEVLALMDELMTALKVVNPRLYDAVMRKL